VKVDKILSVRFTVGINGTVAVIHYSAGLGVRLMSLWLFNESFPSEK
jgi:hypothetical protein